MYCQSSKPRNFTCGEGTLFSQKVRAARCSSEMARTCTFLAATTFVPVVGDATVFVFGLAAGVSWAWIVPANKTRKQMVTNFRILMAANLGGCGCTDKGE